MVNWKILFAYEQYSVSEDICELLKTGSPQNQTNTFPFPRRPRKKNLTSKINPKPSTFWPKPNLTLQSKKQLSAPHIVYATKR